MVINRSSVSLLPLECTAAMTCERFRLERTSVIQFVPKVTARRMTKTLKKLFQ